VNQRGQMTVEAILIMTILLSVALSFSKFAQSNNLVGQVVEGPWKPIQGMIEIGVWESGEKAKSHHPSQKSRHSSNQGEVIPAT
jgi:hypothetical protein